MSGCLRTVDPITAPDENFRVGISFAPRSSDVVSPTTGPVPKPKNRAPTGVTFVTAHFTCVGGAMSARAAVAANNPITIPLPTWNISTIPFAWCEARRTKSFRHP